MEVFVWGIVHCSLSCILCFQLSNSCQELMLQMDRYQVRYHKYMVNIRESSTATLQLYFVLKNLFEVIRNTVNHR